MKMFNGVIVPTVHLNGTSRSVLEEAIVAARGALTQASKVLHETYPNARDYYPQGEGAIQLAMEQHNSRIRRVQDVISELELVYEGMQQP